MNPFDDTKPKQQPLQNNSKSDQKTDEPRISSDSIQAEPLPSQGPPPLGNETPSENDSKGESPPEEPKMKLQEALQEVLKERRSHLIKLLNENPQDREHISTVFFSDIVGAHHRLTWKSLWRMVHGLHSAGYECPPHCVITLGGWHKDPPLNLEGVGEVGPKLQNELTLLPVAKQASEQIRKIEIESLNSYKGQYVQELLAWAETELDIIRRKQICAALIDEDFFINDPTPLTLKEVENFAKMEQPDCEARIQRELLQSGNKGLLFTPSKDDPRKAWHEFYHFCNAYNSLSAKERYEPYYLMIIQR